MDNWDTLYIAGWRPEQLDMQWLVIGVFSTEELAELACKAQGIKGGATFILSMELDILPAIQVTGGMPLYSVEQADTELRTMAALTEAMDAFDASRDPDAPQAQETINRIARWFHDKYGGVR